MSSPQKDDLSSKTSSSQHSIQDEWMNKIQNAREQVIEQGKRVAQRADSEVHRNPWMYIGIGSLFTLILGFLLGRKSNSGRD